MRFLRLYLILNLSLLFLFSCEKINKSGKSPIVNDRMMVIDVVNKYHCYYNNKNLAGLITLYSGELVNEAQKLDLDSVISGDHFELGNIEKSFLKYYNMKILGQDKGVSFYKLILNTQYRNCSVIETFKMKKNDKGRIMILDRQLNFSQVCSLE